MKRAKRIYVLLGVLAVVCVAAFAVVNYQEEQERIANTDEVILEVDADAVESLSWSYDETSLAFHKKEGWLYDDDEAFPVDEEKIAGLLEQFQALGASFIIEDVTDYGQYGLDDPVCTIDIATADESYEIQLGDFSTMDSQRYVSIGDGNVYLVQNDPIDAYEVVLSDLIRHDEIPDFDQVESLTVAGVDSYEAVYLEENTYTALEDDCYFIQDGEDWLPLDTSRVESYLNVLSSLDPTDYVTYTAGAEDLDAFGLDDPELTVTILYTAEDEEGNETQETFTLSVSRDPAERSAAEEADGDEAETEEEITAYVRVGESKIVYQIAGTSYEKLMAAGYDDLRHREVFAADFGDVTGLEVTLEGSTYQLTSEGDGEDKTFFYGEEELETGGLQSALEGLSAASFTDESPDGKEEIALTVTLDNENVQEVEIQLYRYDGEQCLAVVDGQPVSLVPRSSVVDLIEAINAIVL